MKVQEGSVLKYSNFRICKSPLGFSIDQTDHIMELVNEWFPTGNFRNVDTPFRTDYSHEKELLAALPLTAHFLQKAEMEYHGKFGHTLGRIQHIDLMIKIDLCYATCRLATQTVAPTLPRFQVSNDVFNIWLVTHINLYFILLILMMDQMLSGSHGVEIKLKTTQPKIV